MLSAQTPEMHCSSTSQVSPFSNVPQSLHGDPPVPLLPPSPPTPPLPADPAAPPLPPGPSSQNSTGTQAETFSSSIRGMQQPLVHSSLRVQVAAQRGALPMAGVTHKASSQHGLREQAKPNSMHPEDGPVPPSPPDPLPVPLAPPAPLSVLPHAASASARSSGYRLIGEPYLEGA